MKLVPVARKAIQTLTCLLFTCVSLLVAQALGHAATYYVCNSVSECNSGGGSGWSGTTSDSNACTSKSAACKTVKGGIGKLSSSDTLIIGNGTYTGDTNKINYYLNNSFIPHGSTGAYTTVKAEIDGGVTINGATGDQNYAALAIMGTSGQCIDTSGFSPDYTSQTQNYITVQGIVVSGSQIDVSCADHVKIINCGVVDAPNGNVFSFRNDFSQYLLLEGCYAWGGGRAKFGLFHSHYSIVRNCVARSDYTNSWVGDHSDPISVFDDYSAYYNEWQNNISVDSEPIVYNPSTVTEDAGNFANANTSGSSYEAGAVNWTQCISINSTMKFAVSDLNNGRYTKPVFTNCVGWDHNINITSLNTADDLVRSFGAFTGNQLTFGQISKGTYHTGNYQEYFNAYGNTSPHTIQNSILYNFNSSDSVFYPGYVSSYNNIYGTGTIGGSTSNTITTNPVATNQLKYPVRIEPGSALLTAGASGARVGAHIVYQYGKSGTLYGESGYNLLQDGTNGQAIVKMWPFPNEALIKAKMASYSNNGVIGARGFCTGTSKDGSAQTLTKYIWEYLGSQIPSDIYGSTSYKLAAPTGLCVLGSDGQCLN